MPLHTYSDEFNDQKIIWPEICKQPRFSWDNEKKLLTNACHFVNTDSISLLCILLSRVTWFYISQITIPLRLRGGLWQHNCRGAYMERLRIPDMTPEDKSLLEEYGTSISGLAKNRMYLMKTVLDRIVSDFQTGNKVANNKIKKWWKIPPNNFNNEVKKSFGISVPVSERTEWESYLNEKISEFDNLTNDIKKIEEESNNVVFKLFGFTDEEKKILIDHMDNSSLLYEYGSI